MLLRTLAATAALALAAGLPLARAQTTDGGSSSSTTATPPTTQPNGPTGAGTPSTHGTTASKADDACKLESSDTGKTKCMNEYKKAHGSDVDKGSMGKGGGK